MGAVTALAFLARDAVIGNEQVTLAVMPFADLSPGRDKSYFAEGVAEEILSKLATNADIKVLGRTSSAALHERGADPAEIRASLGVTHLLEGSVRSAGSELRLGVRLINTGDGSQQWSEEYRGQSGDIFALQERVAAAVASRLSSSGRSGSVSRESRMTDADAYNLYLAARQIARTRTEPELRRAYGLARQVVAAQPNFALGHALLSELTMMLSDEPNSYGTIPHEKAKRVAVAHAQKAVSLAPRTSEGYAALGLALGRDGMDMLRRAISLDPARSELRLWVALQLDESGQHRQAIEQLQRAVTIDPLWPAVVSRLAYDLAAAGRFEEAVRVIERFERQGGDPAQAARFRATTARFANDLSEVVRWGERALELNPDIPSVNGYLLRAYSLLGLSDSATALAKDPRQTILDAFFRRGYDAAVAAGAANGERVWERPDFEYYTFALAAKRDWAALITTFDMRPMTVEQICRDLPVSVVPFSMALQRAGRDSEAERLMKCLGARLAAIETAGPRSGHATLEAQLLALRGQPDRAMQSLDAAINQGWNEYSHRLQDFPAFDLLRARADFALAQARLDRLIARERREALQLKS